MSRPLFVRSLLAGAAALAVLGFGVSQAGAATSGYGQPGAPVEQRCGQFGWPGEDEKWTPPPADQTFVPLSSKPSSSDPKCPPKSR